MSRKPYRPAIWLALGPCLALGLSLAADPAWAEELPSPIVVTIKDHRFSPAEIRVPAGRPAVLHVINEDATPEEVESQPLQIEKVIPGGARSTVRLRPLEKGRYPFFGEYHPETAQGVVIVE